YDVVFGKLAASSLRTFYGLMAVLPVLAIPLLMGGVTAAEFSGVVLVLLNALFFSLASGMFVSAISRHERKAMGGTLLLILLVAAGLALVGFAVSGGVMPGNARFFLLCPVLAVVLAVYSILLCRW